MTRGWSYAELRRLYPHDAWNEVVFHMQQSFVYIDWPERWAEV